MSVNFSFLDFTEPTKLDKFVPPSSPGIFSILVADINTKTGDFKPIYFNETSNFQKRNLKTYPQFIKWLEEAGNNYENLYVSILEMPESNREERIGIKFYLMENYLQKGVQV